MLRLRDCLRCGLPEWRQQLLVLVACRVAVGPTVNKAGSTVVSLQGINAYVEVGDGC
jgi:hypothetical protein